jgi:hypothetical protein
MAKCQFYKIAVGGGVGRVVGIVSARDFSDEQAFAFWAQTQLPERRASANIWGWPEAVRAIDESGVELFRWTIWDQVQAGRPLTGVRKA